MRRKYLYISWLLFCGLFLCVGDVSAGDVFGEIKGDYGGSIRFRQENIKHGPDLGLQHKPERYFFRLRSTIWGKVAFTDNIGIYGRLANEARYYLGNFKPFETNDKTSDSSRFNEDELVIDNLYLEAKNVFSLPLDIRIGRQDFKGMYGEGFLIYEGTPGDGSRTAYFDAVKATWRITEKHSLDLIYINNRQKDDHLPSLYPARSNSVTDYVNNKRLMNASNEQAFVAYGRSKITPSITIEPYYIYKQEESIGSYHPHLGPKVDLSLNTLGARIAYKTDMWHIRAEWAGQFGEYDDDRKRQGNGGYVSVSQKFANVTWKPEWELGYMRLSGDDPNTGKHEGWDPVFSRAPLTNEIFAYLLPNETMNDSGPIPYYWTNLQLFKLGFTVWPTSAAKVNIFYQKLRAVEKTKATGSSALVLSNASKDRGDLFHLAVDYYFTENLELGVMTEYFIPGDFYNSGAKDSFYLQVQLQFRF